VLKPGDAIDSYRIVSRLKGGGMGQLYLARREGVAGFTRPVAIKVIHPHLARDREVIEMFVSEARLSALIDDPNVVHVHELGETQGLLYLAMEYIHGLSLREVMNRLQKAGRRISFSYAAYIASRVARGLHAAHETTDANGTPLGIVHRDVSPQNVIVAFSGHVKLIDFGIAKAFEGGESTGLTLEGKLPYMAPEHAERRSLDRRADVFALGVILWELLAQRPLFEGPNDIIILKRVRECAIRPLSEVVADVPPALSAVVMKALARDREDRYATAADFARALADAMPDVRHIEPLEIAEMLGAIAPDEIESRRALLSRPSQSGRTALPIDDGLPPRRAGQVSSLHVLTEDDTLETRGDDEDDTCEDEPPADAVLGDTRRVSISTFNGTVYVEAQASAISTVGGTVYVEPRADWSRATVPPPRTHAGSAVGVGVIGFLATVILGGMAMLMLQRAPQAPSETAGPSATAAQSPQVAMPRPQHHLQASRSR
jgi:serine/threonine-protein kinase